jgi:hypothetical protein
VGEAIIVAEAVVVEVEETLTLPPVQPLNSVSELINYFF